jgi:hypothetical protein
MENAFKYIGFGIRCGANTGSSIGYVSVGTALDAFKRISVHKGARPLDKRAGLVAFSWPEKN